MKRVESLPSSASSASSASVRNHPLLVALVALLAVPIGAASVAAQPGSAGSGSGSAVAPAGSATPTAAGSNAGSATPTAGSNATGSAATPTVPTVPSPAATPEAQKKCSEAMAKDPTYMTLVGACLEAMNADRNFAASLATTGDQIAAESRDKALLKQHTEAAAAVAMNQKHVILAYAAMWILSILFVIFLWRKQAALKGEILLLKRDLEVATKADPK